MKTITIGRQNGSGGREVGRILAERLGVPCYDWEIVEETARRSGKTIEEVERNEERARTDSKLYFYGVPAANPLFQQQAEIIKELAAKGPCVFVGRCADRILSGRDDIVNVFVTAPVPDRIKRSMERNGISEKEAYQRITSKDRARADYYLRYAGMTWGDAANYHITVNSGPIGVEGAADLILAYIDRMQ